MKPFRINLIPGDENYTLVISGEADLEAAPDIRELGEISLEETSTLIIDLAAVTFIDSTAIGALVHLHNVATAADRELCLAHVPAFVERLFAITGLDGALDIRNDAWSAEAS